MASPSQPKSLIFDLEVATGKVDQPDRIFSWWAPCAPIRARNSNGRSTRTCPASSPWTAWGRAQASRPATMSSGPLPFQIVSGSTLGLIRGHDICMNGFGGGLRLTNRG